MEGTTRMGIVEHDYNSIAPTSVVTVKNYSLTDLFPKVGEEGYQVLKDTDAKYYDMINALLVMDEICAFELNDKDKGLKYGPIDHSIKITRPSTISYDEDHADGIIRRSIALKYCIGPVTDTRGIVRARRLIKDFINLSDATIVNSEPIHRSNVDKAIELMSQKYSFITGKDVPYAKNHIDIHYNFARMTMLNSVNFLFNILYNTAIGYKNGIYPIPHVCNYPYSTNYRIHDKNGIDKPHVVFDLEIKDNIATISITSSTAKILHYTKLHSADEVVK